MRIVPVLDLSRFDQGGSERRTFLVDLRSAARDVGFFYLSGHGIAADEIERVFAAAKQFFALPEAEKLAIEMVNSPHFRGYTRVAGERTRGQADWREQLDIGVERAPIRQSPGVPAWTRLQGPNQWPAKLPELREALTSWQSRATDVAIRLLAAFALVARSERGCVRADLSGGTEPSHEDRPLSRTRHDARRSGRRRAQGWRLPHPVAAGREQGPAGRVWRSMGRRRADRRHAGRQYRRIAGACLERLSARHGSPRRHAGRRASSAFRFRSSSAPGSTPRSRCSTCRRSWRPKRAGRPAIRTIRCFARSAPMC